MTENESWHLSKSVPITLIFGLITQGAAIVWTVSMMMGDIEVNRTNIGKLDNRIEKVEEMVHEQALALARIDENIKAIRQAVEKMSANNNR